MTPYYERDGIVIYHGDCREAIATFGPVMVWLVDGHVSGSLNDLAAFPHRPQDARMMAVKVRIPLLPLSVDPTAAPARAEWSIRTRD